MEREENQLHGYIIEKVKDFLKNNEISELYRYLKQIWEDLDGFVKEIEEKIVWEEEKGKINLLKKYIKYRENIELMTKKTSEDLFDVLNSERSKEQFDEKIKNAFDILELWELHKYLKKLYTWKNIEYIIRDIESKLTWKVDWKKLKELREYIDKRENLKKKLEQIKEEISVEIYDVLRERFEQFGRLSKLFSDWRKNPDSKFWEEYQKIIWDEVSWDSGEAQNLRNTDVWNVDETWNISWNSAEASNLKNNDVWWDSESKNITWDKSLENVKNNVWLQKEYCLFNLIDRKGSQWFTLSKFINQNNASSSEKISIDYDLVNAISNISLDNFCEQEWFYRWMLFNPNDVVSTDEWESNVPIQGVMDFSKIELMSPSSITCEECMIRIRNSIAHWDFMYLTEDSWVTIYINDKKWFEAFIDSSFFDDWFCLGQYASDISCDFILWWNNRDSWKDNIYEYIYKWEKIPKLVNYLWQNFKESLTTVLDEKYNAVKINLNQQKWEKELEIIDSEKNQEPWLLFWLLSDNERPYVHNLLNAISVSMLNKILSNPNITYNELSNDLAVETIWSERNLFTFHDRDKIIKLCLDMLPDLLMLQWLKAFYVNILEIPDSRTPKLKELAHIRNALIHWYYKIVNWKVIMWDFDIKRNKETREKRIYDIETLRNEAKKYENFYHSRKNGFSSLVNWIWLVKKNSESV